MDLDWFLRQSALHQPHRGQNGSSGSVGWGVQGVCSRAFIEKEAISCPASGPHREKSSAHSCHFGTLLVQEFGKLTNRIGNYRRIIFLVFLVMNSPPLPLHHISVTVPGSLINFVWSLTVFSSLRISECSPWSRQISPNCLLLGVSLFVFYLGLFYAKPCTGDGSKCVPQWKPSLGFLFITKHNKKSLMEVDDLLSLVMCLWDPCLQVCDTGGIVGARCVPAAAPPASAQNPMWNWQAHSWLLCPCFWQCFESKELECESKSSSVVPHLLKCFCYWKVLKTFWVYSVFFSVDAKRLRWLLGPKTLQYSFE